MKSQSHIVLSFTDTEDPGDTALQESELLFGVFLSIGDWFSGFVMEWELWAYLFPVVTLTLPPLVRAASSTSWLPWAPLSLMPTDQLSPSALIGAPSPWVSCSVAVSMQVPPQKCGLFIGHQAWILGPARGRFTRLGEAENQILLIQQAAPLSWGVVLRPGRASIFLALSPRKNVGTPASTSASRHCVKGKGGLTWAGGCIWSKLASKHLKSY